MAITYKERNRTKEPWGIDVGMVIFDEETSAVLREITLRFDSEKQITAELPDRVAKAIQALSTDMPNFVEGGCGHACGGKCSGDHQYSLVQMGERKTVDVVEGPRTGTLSVGEVEKVLRAKGLLLPGQKWGDFALGV